MLSSLDPAFELPERQGLQDMQVQTAASSSASASRSRWRTGVIKVISPIDDTPAAKAGILAGDLITALDGERCRA